MWKADPLQLLGAVILDGLLGDPQGWPHITRLAGKLSLGFEAALTSLGSRSVFLGAVFWVMVCGSMLLAFFSMDFLLGKVHPLARWGFELFVLYQSIAASDLSRHAKAVLSSLASGDLDEARRQLSRMAGRDTEKLDHSEISRAAIESVAESATDGFIAPLFWGAVGGAAGALLYRTANTLDSMVGHRNPRYELFGKVSARMDDCLSWIPARICALLSVALYGLSSFKQIRREASQHSSPNAGWSEAAAAHALGLRLGGTNFYDGEPVDGPIFHLQGRIPNKEDIESALGWLRGMVAAATAVMVFLCWVARHFLSP